MMFTATRPALVNLSIYVAIIFFIGINGELWPAGIPSSVSSPFLYSVDVLLEGSTDEPLSLGIRRGQTVVQAAERFCVEQGFDQNMQTVLMPQLMKVLEDGMTASLLEDSVPAEYDAAAVPPRGPADQSEMTNQSTGAIMGSTANNDDPTITLEVSLDGRASRTVYYYGGQDPTDVAANFCAESLDSSRPPEVFARCLERLSASIIERMLPFDVPSRYEAGSKQQGQPAATAVPWLTVPLNIGGLETALQIYRGSKTDDLAEEFCRQEEFALNGPTLDSCFSQIIQIVRRAIMAHTSRERERERITKRRGGGTKQFTFNIPVTLAGLGLRAEFRTDETPRESALRFCVPNLPAIESALGTIEIDSGDDDGGSGGMDDSGLDQGVHGRIEEEREALLETCAMIVEDAINAVLLGLRERVLEAEMTLLANATEPVADE